MVELKKVEPCTLPVNDPTLQPEYFGKKLGFGFARVPCKGCGVQYDRREIEEYSHPFAHHVSRFLCPKGHLGVTRRVWKAVSSATGDGEANL